MCFDFYVDMLVLPHSAEVSLQAIIAQCCEHAVSIPLLIREDKRKVLTPQEEQLQPSQEPEQLVQAEQSLM